MTMTDIEVATIRDQFPGLARMMPDGRPAAFLDGPGGSQPHMSVVAAVTEHLERSMANLGGVFATGRETTETVDRGRYAAADLLGATADEIAFGANMTTLNFQLAHAVARTLTAGDEIVVTALDHDANVAPWLLVARDHGLTVRTAPIRVDDATLDVDELEKLLGPRTKVVAFTLASNALGTVPDAARVAAAAHRVGALAWCDGVHYAPHRRIDRTDLGADVVLCSPYKFFGPHLGVAAIRPDLAESLPADRVRPASEQPPGHRFEAGTQSHEAIAGFVAAVDYLAGLGHGGRARRAGGWEEHGGRARRAGGWEEHGADRRARLDDAYARIGRYESLLARRFLAAIAEMPGLRLYGIADPARLPERTPTFCFTVDGMTPSQVSEALAADGIFTWDGNYYALSVMEGLGLQQGGGAVRVGFLHYNTADEVDRCRDALIKLVRAGPSMA